ncbi:phosphoribosylanthranilate isomerase [Salipiger sp. IMCC34102]|uniref:phosphoribosylanthranilate isomerase n=1 Tax=Salipiger sp. IMCC34102 TaxID=2510647 RepID=UPI00101B7DAA|nr:phosphoribosylanthranilate isomerase [Salipiger sp. IMCC34102]RYH01881.1 phosphoribosylanthranilate isomerase [Salipiger sp. IMCC34102]
MTRIKICGLRSARDVAAAVASGADDIGLVFFPKSPRHLTLDEAAELALAVPLGVRKVGLVVDMEDEALDELIARVPLDMLQLHGKETPERVAEIRERTGVAVMKAIGVSTAEDLDGIDAYEAVCEQILIDAKAPKGSDLPGGNGETFDWTILEGRAFSVPWMLAGGLRPSNVADAIAITGAPMVDVSSGVERRPGDKDPDAIADFCQAVRGA